MAVVTWDIVLHIEDGEIIGVECKEANGQVTQGVPITLAERKEVKKSLYGLRSVDTLYAHDSKFEPAASVAVPRKCYMYIGGFKVEVPCT